MHVFGANFLCELLGLIFRNYSLFPMFDGVVEEEHPEDIIRHFKQLVTKKDSDCQMDTPWYD